jgi:GDP/UDP-N,N'-diacetylbacillosamine 2-epimerase (hydrolysing)
MKIGVLTSSRADYGIYQPLLKKFSLDARFDLEIIAFGMHLQENQGNTIENIRMDGYPKIHTVGTMPENDSIFDISFGYGALVSDFARFWEKHTFDLTFALGDRWEMSAAVQASIPFELKLAHLYGGETTLGATDNIYRHQISLASRYHFTAAEPFSERLKALIDTEDGVHTVGSISLEGLESMELPEWSDVRSQFKIPFDEFILLTFHPESVGASRNEDFAQITFAVLEILSKQHNILITRANSDAMGSLFNRQFERLQELNPANVKLVSALGKLNYFKAMIQCSFMLGNTSSGIVEAASFKKWVINVGDRQKGRLRNDNVLDVSFEQKKILDVVTHVGDLHPYVGENKYVKPGTTDMIIEIISNDTGL